MNQWLRLALEYGPLAVFFFTNAKFGIMAGTGAFMVATLMSLSVSWLRERRVSPVLLVGSVFVIVFGGLTLYLQDELFIKIKPTVVNLLFATCLFVGLGLRRNLLQTVLGNVWQMDEAGWRLLTWRWAFFFLVLAALNEVVWRSVDTDSWASFKVFAVLPLTLLFSAAQVPLILRHQISTDPGDKPEPT